MVVGLVAYATKNRDGMSAPPSYSGGLRNRVPELCLQGALGRHLVQLYTLERGGVFPEPGTEEYAQAFLWPHSRSHLSVPIAYRDHNDRTKQVLLNGCLLPAWMMVCEQDEGWLQRCMPTPGHPLA